MAVHRHDIDPSSPKAKQPRQTCKRKADGLNKGD